MNINDPTITIDELKQEFSKLYDKYTANNKVIVNLVDANIKVREDLEKVYTELDKRGVKIKITETE